MPGKRPSAPFPTPAYPSPRRGNRRSLLVPGVLLLLLAAAGCSPSSPGQGRPVQAPPAQDRAAPPPPGQARLLIFVGAASKPPTEEAAAVFEKRYGVGVEANYGGSGTLLSQMKLARRGDIYFPGSSDYMEKAKREGLVRPETERKVAYLVPAINVPRGNPFGIRELRDLARPGLRVGIANPETVCLGGYAVEIVEKNLRPDEKEAFRRNLATLGESCEKTANLITFRAVDAIIGWSVFEHWNPEKIETVKLKPREIIRIGYLPIAVSVYSSRPDLAQKFIDFLLSPAGQAIYRKHGYFMTPEEAFRYVGEEKPVGGEYPVPPDWLQPRDHRRRP